MSVELIKRVPPQAIEAEIAVLGAMMLEAEAAIEVMETLREGDFYKESHRAIFRAISSLAIANEPVDQLTVTQRLMQLKLLDLAGGPAGISQILARVPSAANVAYYAKIVRQKSVLRGIIQVATGLVSEAYQEDVEIDEILDGAQRQILQLKQHISNKHFVRIGELVANPVLKNIENMAHSKSDITGVPTGFIKLDSFTAGFQPSDLIILAGRPSMGKTAVALSMASLIAVRYQKTVGFFSLEMSTEQIIRRLLSSESKVDHQLLRTGKIPQDLWHEIIDAASRLESAPLYVDDTPGLTIMEIRTRARRLRAEHGLDIIFVDYLQLARGYGRTENRQQEISMISQGLKALAKELNVPVIALSQLSRAVEQRGANKRPQLSDLRESGAIEQDADVVLFIYREHVYSKDPADEYKADLIIAKQRNGPLGNVPLQFTPRFARFDNPAYTDEDEGGSQF
ncbi:MAG TPA: replicative DNA helicase [Candidatus Marinimicrobia bacterium]|nr:replicative DNA helicase [Candidatus Neomarinimicrobiota bacterium]